MVLNLFRNIMKINTCASVSERPNKTSAIDLHLKIPNRRATRLAVQVQAKYVSKLDRVMNLNIFINFL